MQTGKQKLGAWGEEQASLFLLRQGYTIVARNFRRQKGEIDIIARDREGVWSFLEVKTRTYGEGSAERATNCAKQKKMRQTAMYYCFENNLDIDHTAIKFEHVSVYVDRQNKKVSFKKYIISN